MEGFKLNKVFQIYIGNPSYFELKCMEKTQELFDIYLLFSDEVKGAFPLSGILNSVKRNRFASYLYERAVTETEKSDILRYTFLAENPDYWYLDCDATLEKIPKFEGGRPYFADFRGGADGFVIYGNNDKSVFNLLLENLYFKVKSGKGLRRSPYNCVKRQPNIIPKSFFKHKGV